MKPVKQFGIRSLCLIFVFYALAASLSAAWLTNQPTTRTQPDGSILECFVSGDEFFQRLHDADNYTLIQHPKTGYYHYAEQDGEDIKAGAFRAGLDEAQRQNLTPDITISERLYKEKRSSMFQSQGEQRAMPNTGTVNNLIIFIRFADQDEFGQQISVYDGWLNTNTVSLKNYFLEASYNALTVESPLFPPAVNGNVVSYQDSLVRERYVPYDEETAPLGWHNEDEREILEHNLLRAAVMHIEQFVPLDLNIDADGDGVVDNITFIVAGSDQGGLLWPHKWQLHSYEVYIHGKRVWVYNLQLQNFLYYNNVSVFAHELFHSIGAPDLYRAVTQDIAPVNVWDVMAANQNPPQHMSAYMKYKYGHWIASIPVIAANQTYSLNPLTSSAGQVFRINSPYTTDEFFLVEYRKKAGIFEISLPGSGLLVWRVNTTCGNGNADGPPDELYVYRPDGTQTVNGYPLMAYFSSDVGRTVINDATNPNSFLSNGTAGGLYIYDIGAPGETISFTKGVFSFIDFAVTNPYTEGFNNITCPPTDWWSTIQTGTVGFDHVISSTTPAVTPYEGTRMLRYACRNAAAGSKALISTKAFKVDNLANYDYQVAFRMYRDTGYPSNYDRIEVFVNSVAVLNGNQTQLATIHRCAALYPTVPTAGWYEYSYTFYPEQTGYYFIIIKAYSANGNHILIDAFSLQRVSVSTTTCRWQGTYSDDWHDPGNWRNGTVPDAGKDAIIPYDAVSLPSVENYNAFCRDLYVQDNAVLMVAGRSMFVYRNAFVSGSLFLLNNASLVEVSQNLYFSGNSSAVCYSAGATVEVYRDCIITNPEQFSMSGGVLKLSGSLSYGLSNTSPLAIIDRLYINKTGGATVLYSSFPASVLRINTEFNIPSYSSFTVEDEAGTIECGTPFAPVGNVLMSQGNLSLFQNQNLSLPPASYLNSLTLLNNCQITLQADLKLLGNLNCDAGTLLAMNRTINIAGNWNTSSIAGFIGTGSTVIFDGSADQICNSSDFNILVLNKPGGSLIVPNSKFVYVNSYDYQAGSLVVNGGQLHVYDLADISIVGNYVLNSGQINLTQDSTNSINLNANLEINGGLMTVSGGNSSSLWASNASISFVMSGGVLDFKNQGIIIMLSAWSLNDNITGGLIRTAGDFICQRSDFQPSGGTIELYGANDTGLYFLNANSYLMNLNINKMATRTGDSRSAENLPLRANTVSLASNIYVFGNISITSGSLNLNGYALTTESDMNIAGGLIMTNEDDILTVFGSLYWNQGAFASVTNGSIYLYADIHVASDATLLFSGENRFIFKGIEQTGIHNYSSNCTFASVEVQKETGSISTFNSQNITIQNNLNLFSPSIMYVASILTVNSMLDISSGAALYLTNNLTAGSVNISGYYESNSGVLTCLDNFFLYGQMVLNNSSCLLDKPFGTSGILFPLYGALTLNYGIFVVTNHGVQVGPAASFSFNDGGGIRVGWNFVATHPNSFQPSAGTIELQGARNALIQCNNGNYFHYLVIDKPAGFIVSTDAGIDVYKDLFVVSGTYSPGTGTTTMIYQNLNVYADGVLNAAGAELKFVGSDLTVITAVPPITVSNLTFYKQPGCTAVLGSDLTLSGTAQVLINRGTFQISDNTMQMSGSITAARAKLALSEGSILDLGNGSSITVSGFSAFIGTLDAMGSAANPAKITSSTGYYALNLEASSIIKANYCIFEKLNSSGIHFYPGSALNPDYPMSNCTFQYGQNRGALIWYDNGATTDYIIPNASFPVALGFNYKNVKKTTSVGSLTFLNATGPHAGPEYEIDDYGTVHWITNAIPDPPLNLTITTDGTYVTLNWSAVTGVTGYKIYRALSPDEMGSAILVGTTSLTSWSDNDSSDFDKAFYFVRSYVE